MGSILAGWSKCPQHAEERSVGVGGLPASFSDSDSGVQGDSFVPESSVGVHPFFSSSCYPTIGIGVALSACACEACALSGDDPFVSCIRGLRVVLRKTGGVTSNLDFVALGVSPRAAKPTFESNVKLAKPNSNSLSPPLSISMYWLTIS